MADGDQAYEIGVGDSFTPRPASPNGEPPIPDLSQFVTPAPPPVVGMPDTGPAPSAGTAPAGAPVSAPPPAPPTSLPVPPSPPPTLPPPVASPGPVPPPVFPPTVPSAPPIAPPAAPVTSTPPPAASAPLAAQSTPLPPPIATAPAASDRSDLPPTADPDILAALAAVSELGGSDLHVSADARPMIRVHGSLEPFGPREWSREKTAGALLSLLDAEKREHFEATLELDWSFALTEEARFRANYYWQRGAIGAAFRIIPTEIKPIESLGLPKSVNRFAELPRGLVLVTGPTGSGKSTTLASLIDLVNETRADHIMTVEDPIEFVHRNKTALINQREVGADTKSFASALKHVLRQDPDVILVGELRDLETISVALTAAETGHLVYATLHTQSAPQTIDRVIDVFPPHQQEQIRAQLAATLQGVVCQTLVKRADGKGRVLVAEVMVTTPAIANLIREGKTHQIPTAMQVGGDSGMQTLDQHLAALVNAGTITREAALEKVQDPEVFARLVQGGSSSTPSTVGFNDFDSFGQFPPPGGLR